MLAVTLTAPPSEEFRRNAVDLGAELSTFTLTDPSRALPSDADPFQLTALRQSIRLAFVAALQHLPPRQRAALLLVEVLGWSAAEVAECLDMSVAAVNSALQRARATVALARRDDSAEPLTDEQSRLLERYVEAFERYDIEALVMLLRDDATLSMPPGLVTSCAW